jgi:polypeptide N-acetylgalactosaminyltransferase
MRNLKRVVEVWFDEYKFMFYKDHPERTEIDAGDLTEVIELRKKLNCKSFKYYLETVAPQILERNPIEKRPDFASGAIQSKANQTLCISNAENYNSLVLASCSENLVTPALRQFFNLTWHRSIIPNDLTENCFNDNIIWPCHFQQGNQMFRFDLVI